MWSKEKIKIARANPRTFAKGFSKEAFDITDPFVLHLGENSCENIDTIVQIQDEKLLWIEPPEAPGAPYRLSGKFYDESGNLIFRIDENEWSCPTTVWDLEVKGRQIWIRKKLGEFILHLEANPPHGLRIHHLKMMKGSVGIEIDRGVLTIKINGFKMQIENSGFKTGSTLIKI